MKNPLILGSILIFGAIAASATSITATVMLDPGDSPVIVASDTGITAAVSLNYPERSYGGIAQGGTGFLGAGSYMSVFGSGLMGAYMGRAETHAILAQGLVISGGAGDGLVEFTIAGFWTGWGSESGGSGRTALSVSGLDLMSGEFGSWDCLYQPESCSGAAESAVLLPFTFGQPFTFQADLWSSVESLQGDVSLQSGFSVSNIRVFDSSGNLIPGAEVAPIPEPATLLLFGTGLAGAGRLGRRRRL